MSLFSFRQILLRYEMQRECEMQGKDWQHPQGKEKVNRTKHLYRKENITKV